MSALSAPYYDPVARDENLDRLETVERSDELSADVWEEVHNQVQQNLAKLDSVVRRRFPSARIEAAKTTGKQFFLFTHRTFAQADDSVDPVVVGITFVPSGDGVRIESDASGERSGDPIVTVGAKTVRPSRTEVIHAALEVAGQLTTAADRIAAALVDPSRCTK